ncbi:hypothetical protein [Streptomyces chryseus]|uniref:hypothetical protein n=1 Tax=Streptomyces chryseus TaxID=68186 RepID=UPI00110F78A7|nr:hypothetical protein [Streptomyces chryseus]
MNPPKERNIPPSSSPLAPPVLTAKVGRLKVGGRGGDEDQAAEEHQDQEHEQQAAQQPAPGRSRGGRRLPPAAADAIPTTIRFDTDEAAEIDQFVLELRVAAHRRNLDKAEVFREVLRLAREHEPTRRALLKRLK